MRVRLKSVVTSLCLLGAMTVPAFAANAADNLSQEEIIKKLNERTILLESELREMRVQIKELKGAKSTKQAVLVKQANKADTTKAVATQKVQQQNVVFEEPASISAAEVQPQPLLLLSKTPLYLGGTPVLISPYIGLRSDTDTEDLIVNLPSVNEDLRLLKQREEIAGLYEKAGFSVPTQPMVDLSGKVEAKVVGEKPYVGGRTSDIDASAAELDIAAFVNSWATGFMAITYDDNPPSTVGRRIDNSRVYIDKAFLTIGNLIKSPWYVTAGQFYVPFGQYSSLMVSDPLTKLVGRVKARAVLFGYNQKFNQNTTINASIFGFKGDSGVNSSNRDNINNFGANVDYIFNYGKWSGDAAVSYIANMADANGMQKNGSNADGTFKGFARVDNENIKHKIPGLDVRGSLGYGDYMLLAEYVTAARKFAVENMTFNNSGAKPGAFHIEGVYNFIVWGKKSLIAIGYDQTQNALALLLPKQRYVTTLSTSLWEGTIQSLEYRHDINYGAGDQAKGQNISIDRAGLGHTSDTVTLQVGIYF